MSNIDLVKSIIDFGGVRLAFTCHEYLDAHRRDFKRYNIKSFKQGVIYGLVPFSAELFDKFELPEKETVMFSAYKRYKSLDMIKYLAARYEYYSVYLAVIYGNLDAVKFMHMMKPDRDNYVNVAMAFNNKRYDIVEYLLFEGYTINDGVANIGVSIPQNLPGSIVTEVLKRGVNMRTINSWINYAVKFGNVSVLMAIKDAGVQYDPIFQDYARASKHECIRNSGF